MVIFGIVFGHVMYSKGIEIDKAKIQLIAHFPPQKATKEICFFLGHARFNKRFIKDFSAIPNSLCNLLTKDTPFERT